jgi:hypothetical protein
MGSKILICPHRPDLGVFDPAQGFKQAFDTLNAEADILSDGTDLSAYGCALCINSQPPIFAGKKIFLLTNTVPKPEDSISIAKSCDIVITDSLTDQLALKEAGIKAHLFAPFVAPRLYPFVSKKQGKLCFCGDLDKYGAFIQAVDLQFPLTPNSAAENTQQFYERVAPYVIRIMCCESVTEDLLLTVACGTVVFVNAVAGIEQVFAEDSEIIIYRSLPDLTYKLHYFLHNPDIASQFAIRAYKRLLNSHTYLQRANQILHLLESQKEDGIRDETRTDDARAEADARPVE